MPITNVERPYNALNGEELRKVVIDKALEAARLVLEKSLSEIPDLAASLTFPVIRNLVFKLAFEAYPAYGDGKKVYGGFAIGPPAPEGSRPVSVAVQVGIENVGELVPPDQIRVDFGLGVPTAPGESMAVALDPMNLPERNFNK